MFGKNDEKSQKELNQLIDKFHLEGLNDDEKETLKSMAKDSTLVTNSSIAITDFAFKKTLINQNWMILSKLTEISNKLDK